jgi:hypothetical protein
MKSNNKQIHLEIKIIKKGYFKILIMQIRKKCRHRLTIFNMKN